MSVNENERAVAKTANASLPARDGPPPAVSKHFTELTHRAALGFFALDRTGTIKALTRAGSRLLGLHHPEAVGLPFVDFLEKESVPGFHMFLESVFDRSPNVSCEAWLITAERQQLEAHIDGALAPSGETCLAAVARVTERGRRAMTPPLAETSPATDSPGVPPLGSADPLAFAEQYAVAGFWHWDLRRGQIEWSPELFRLFGLNPADTPPSFEIWRRTLHPEDRVAAEERIQAAIRNRQPLRSEYRIIFPTGKVSWICALGNTRYDEHGEPLVMSGICLDITEQKQNERALRCLQEELQLILDAVPAMIWYKDTENRILRANAAVARSLGLPKEEIEGKPTAEFYPEEAECYYQDDLLVIQTGLPRIGIEEPYRLPSGELRWIRTDKVPLKDDSGRVTQVLAMATDITRQKLGEIALLELNHRLSLAAAIARLGFYEFDIAADRATVNDDYLAHLGYRPGELDVTGEVFWSLLHPDDKPRIKAEFERQISGEKQFFQGEYRLRNRNGGWTWVVDRAQIIARDPEGRAQRLVGVHLDFTKQKSAEQAIRRSLDLNRAVIASLQDGFCLLDPNGIHLEVNAALCRITGFSSEELIGVGWPHPYWPPECRSEIDTAFRQTLNGVPREFELSYVRKNGERFPVTVSPSLVKDESGETVSIAVTIKDVGQRRQTEEALRQKTQELEYYFAHAKDMFLIGSTHGYIRRVNPQWEEVLGYRVNELEGRRLLDLVHPDDVDATLRVIETLANQGSVQNFTHRWRHKNGSYRFIEWTASAPLGTLIIGTARDVTARRQTEHELMQAAAVFSSTHDGVIITDAAQQIVAVNRAFTELTGYSEEEVIGKTPEVLRSKRHDAEFYRDMWSMIEATGHWQGEIWNRRKSGEIYPELLTISAIVDPQRKVSGYVGVFTDITGLKRHQEQLELLAHYDPLTGLINRRLLIARLEHALQIALRKSESGALLLIDLDRFKEVNDCFGHPAGDELLKKVALRFKNRLRSSDSLARLGGDEFAVMLESPVDARIAARIAGDLLDTLTDDISLSSGANVNIGVSIGVALFPDHGLRVSDLLAHTDAALYEAKREGRNTFRFFSEQLTQKAREQRRMEQRLRQALKNDELKVYYQAQMDLASGRVIGAEALVRWLDPVEGLILPERFIGLSEETRLIVPLGDWVLQTACRQVEAWARAGLPPIRLAVNLSAFQASQPETAGRVVEILTETGFVPQALELELTETALRANQINQVNLFVEMQHLGVTLALDDFGTGLSSLTTLEKHPVDALKIDRSFITALPGDPTAVRITTAIIGLAHTLGFRTIAEGVETKEQLAFLAAEGCDACQGYLFGPPLPAEEFAQRYLRAA